MTNPGLMTRNRLALALGGALLLLAGSEVSRALAKGPDAPAAPVDGDSAPDLDTSARAKQIESLIAQLGADDFFGRERAQQELAEIGYEAFDALSEAADNSDDIEIKLRAGYLVRMMRLASVVDSDPPEIKELLGKYENLSEAERISLIKQVAAQADEKGLPVLCRLVRFERSAVLSKEAAAAVLTQKWPSDKTAAARRADIIRRGIGASARPAAAWLRTYLAGHKEPAAEIDDWQKLVAAEERRAVESPHQTKPEILAALWRETATLLRQLGRDEEADELLMRLVEREEGSISADSLEELLRWLVDQRAFGVVDRLAEKFADRFQQEPLLLYSLAEARQAEGKEQLVTEAIAKALALGEGQEPFKDHWRVATELMRRHRWRWAEAEFRRVAELAPDDNRFSIDARARLSEVLHDRGSDEEAGELLDGVVDVMEKNVAGGNEDENAGRTVEATRARMHYFHACGLPQPEDKEEKKERLRLLLAALDADPTDADVLIAVYRTEDLDPPLAEQNRQRIRSAAELFRQQMQQQPDDPTPYNQFAWLIANTEGDYKEALRASEKSLELVRANPRMVGSEASFLDTLGRCHYALGDLESAVQTQTKAVELDPESGLMRKQLDLFRQKLDEQKKK